MVRKLASPVRAVYAAWTEPRLLVRWLASGADTVTSVTMDLRIGGRYRLEGVSGDGKLYSITGTYLDLDEHRRIAMSWLYDGPIGAMQKGKSVVTADFVELGPELTELTLTHEKLSERDAAEIYRIAWTECIGKLEDVAGCENGPSASTLLTDNSEFYTDSQRDMQNRFATRRLADRLEAVAVHDHLSAVDAALIARQNMFFLATADAFRQPNCSYKGGTRGFVMIVDERTLAYPDYNGNGMHLSVGNIADTNKVGLLFVDFERQARLRVLGRATVIQDDLLINRYPGAERIICIKIEAVFANCPRYVHKMQLVEESAFVPKADVETPVPTWKRLGVMADVLSDEDKKYAGTDTDLNKSLNKD